MMFTDRIQNADGTLTIVAQALDGTIERACDCVVCVLDNDHVRYCDCDECII